MDISVVFRAGHVIKHQSQHWYLLSLSDILGLINGMQWCVTNCWFTSLDTSFTNTHTHKDELVELKSAGLVSGDHAWGEVSFTEFIQQDARVYLSSWDKVTTQVIYIPGATSPHSASWPPRVSTSFRGLDQPLNYGADRDSVVCVCCQATRIEWGGRPADREITRVPDKVLSAMSGCLSWCCQRKNVSD